MTKMCVTFFIYASTLIIVAKGQETTDSAQQEDLTTSQAWGFGMLAGFGVSLIGLLAALLVVAVRKCLSQARFKFILNLLYSLGCGAMIGDAMIHILPESYQNENVKTTFVSLIFISAVCLFIIVERMFVFCGITHAHWEGGESEHEHCDHDHPTEKKQGKEGKETGKENTLSIEVRQGEGKKSSEQPPVLAFNVQEDIIQNNSSAVVPNDATGSIQVISTPDQKKPEENKSSDSSQTEEQGGICLKMKGKGIQGYLNLISSFIHNFFDGFAVGAAFASRSKSQYIPVLIAIFAHEIPRQMGDVGILIKNRFNNCQTIFWNAIINTTSLIGVIVGLGLGEMGEAVQIYILSFVAGNFIYIGADIWRNLMKNKDACMNILEFLSFAVGVGAMYLVLLAEA